MFQSIDVGKHFCNRLVEFLRHAVADLYGSTEGAKDSLGQLKGFLQGRWKGVRPVLMGRNIRETEMTRALYELSFNVNGGKKA